MLTDETKQELVERCGLTPGEVRCVESKCVRPMSVRALQACTRAYAILLRDERCCSGLCKVCMVEITELRQ